MVRRRANPLLNAAALLTSGLMPRDVNLYPCEGFTPWLGATADAPFPGQ